MREDGSFDLTEHECKVLAACLRSPMRAVAEKIKSQIEDVLLNRLRTCTPEQVLMLQANLRLLNEIRGAVLRTAGISDADAAQAAEREYPSGDGLV